MQIDALDLNDLGIFERRFPHPAFDALRGRAPVWWHPPSELSPDGEGYWVVVDHAHTLEVSRDPGTYSSESGGDREGGGTLIEDLRRGVAVGTAINMTDGATHRRLRGLISRAFTPQAIGELESDLRARARSILDSVGEAGECDFVLAVARELPLQVIADMLGVPQQDRHELFDWAMATLRPADAQTDMQARMRAAGALHAYGQSLIEEKRRKPDGSMLSTVIHARQDTESGESEAMSGPELASFFSLLWSAGSDTTWNAIAGSLLALIDRPDAAEELRGDASLWSSAVEEFLRYVSPVTYNRRTVTRATRLAGERLEPGDKVTIWYPSANRDVEVFRQPDRLDLSRKPNPHLAFNIGEYVCVGANLARRELRAMLQEVLSRWTDFELTGPVRYARSNKHGGIESVPIRFRRIAD
ncbi:MAG: cytochrome P450 [Proteobacteria bacterium]|nr:cytochrome P450 [Pseudomonadota bacterium]